MVNRFLRILLSYLRAGNYDAAVSHVNEKLIALPVDSQCQSRAFRGAIALFVQHGRLLAGLRVFGRMRASGFLPSPSLRAQMAVVTLVEGSQSELTLLQCMQDHFMNASFGESCLRDLLILLARSLDYRPAFIDQVAEEFLRVKDSVGDHRKSLTKRTIGLLVDIHSRAGSPLTAERWLSLQRDSALPHGTPSPQPYTTLLRDLRSVSPEDTVIYRWIMEQMERNNVLPDLGFYNALISVEVSRKRYTQAFAIYRLLWEHRTASLTPDAYTYAPLFHALKTIHKQRRNVRTRRIRMPSNAPTTRQLYREMLECHVMRTKAAPSSPPVVDVALLNHALHAFIKVEDYPAALVVLDTFRLCEFKPTLGTYRAAISSLMKRIEKELIILPTVDDPHNFWSYRFVGMSTYPIGQDVNHDARLLAEILRMGTTPRLSLEYIPSQQVESNQPRVAGGGVSEQSANLIWEVEASVWLGKKHNMPSVMQLGQSDDEVLDDEFDMIPLERIIRRAVLAARPSISSDPQHEVSNEFAEAEKDMVVLQS